MTDITYDSGALVMTVKGHAGSAPAGEDLVCCAISTLTETLIAALQENKIHRAVESNEAAGLIRIRALPSDAMVTIARIAFDTIAAGYAGLALEYPEHVSYKTEFTMPVRKGD